ncbi:MAG: hypothetical protein ABIP50_01910 [Candidatus Saccharimonadales bacterium]
MSVTRVKNLPTARGHLRSAGLNTREAADQVAKELNDLAKEEENTRIGAAAVQLSIDDERDDLLHHADQLLAAVNAARGVPATPPAQPEEPAEPVAPAADITPPVTQTAPEPAATVVTPVAAVTEVIVTPPVQVVPVPVVHHWYEITHWDWRHNWWLMLIGAGLGLLFSALLWDWFVKAAYAAIATAMPTVTAVGTTIHWFAWPIVGLAIAGAIISPRITARRVRRATAVPATDQEARAANAANLRRMADELEAQDPPAIPPAPPAA